MSPEEEPREPEQATPPDPAAKRRVIRAEDLLQGAQEVLIQHGSEYYLLGLTRNGRLLLTK